MGPGYHYSPETLAYPRSKQFQKILQKQGLKFKLNTKVVSGKREGDSVKLVVDAAKGGKEETVRCFSAVDGRRLTGSLTPTLCSSLLADGL